MDNGSAAPLRSGRLPGMTAEHPRPVLRPGLRLARRCDGHLQAGLSPALRSGLPDTPLGRRLARALHQLDADPPEGADGLLVRLAGLLVDGRELARTLEEHPDQGPEVAAAYHRHGAAARSRWRHRADVRVQVTGPEGWREVASSLLARQGIGLVPSDRPGDLRLLLHVGEPSAALADPLLRAGMPHLWAGTSAGEVGLGPFVDPGRTPCRRCVVADLSGRDPGHALLREQYVDPVGDVPEPVDPALMTMAVAWAVRDVVAWVDGSVPSSWGATIQLPAEGAPREQRHRRQPECGCSWTQGWRAG